MSRGSGVGVEESAHMACSVRGRDLSLMIVTSTVSSVYDVDKAWMTGRVVEEDIQES